MSGGECSAPNRLPYKASKVRNYWPDLTPDERRPQLYGVWHDSVETLESEMSRIDAVLPKLDIGCEPRCFEGEDTPDAIVCTWVAICALQGCDKESALWVPTPA